MKLISSNMQVGEFGASVEELDFDGIFTELLREMGTISRRFGNLNPEILDEYMLPALGSRERRYFDDLSVLVNLCIKPELPEFQDGFVEELYPLLCKITVNNPNLKDFLETKKSSLDEIDYLGFLFDRSEVESKNLDRFLNTFKPIIGTCEMISRFRGKIDIAFNGYDDDPRELFLIEEVRDFIKMLDEQFPYWFYFLDTASHGLKLIMFSLCRIDEITNGGYVFRQADINAFIDRQLSAMNLIFEKCEFSLREFYEREKQVADYFSSLKR